MAEKKTYPGGFTKGFRIECNITYRCNALCFGCNKGVGLMDWTKKEDMTVEQMKRAIDQLLEQRIYVRRFTFCGGESILHKDLQLFINEAARLPKIQRGRVLTNGLPSSQAARDKIVMPNDKWKWVVSPLDDPNDNKSGKNDWTKRDTQRYHQPFWISPADIGMHATFEKCTIRGYCGVGLDSSGFSMCGKATMLGRLLGVDPTMQDKDGDIYEHVNRPIPEICKHCQYGLGGGGGLGGTGRGRRRAGASYEIERRWRAGELQPISETFAAAFARHESQPLVQLERF